jgi:hypothetical protein
MFGSRNGQYLGTQLPFFSAQTLTKGSNAAPVFPTPAEWWKTNEGSGTTLATQSGSGDTLTFNGTWTNPGSAFPFVVPTYNGTTSIATGANFTNTNFTGLTPFSVSVWIYQAVNGVQVAIIGDYGNISNFGWELDINSSNQVSVAFGGGTFPTNFLGVHSSGTISLNALHHIVFTYDGSQQAANVKMYIDGVLQTTNIDQNALSSSIASGNAVSVGARTNPSPVILFSGAIADMRIYAANLSAGQVSTLFAGGVV